MKPKPSAAHCVTVTGKTIQRMFAVNDPCPHVLCPFDLGGKLCDGVPHISGTLFGQRTPPTSTSGPGLTVELYCEHGHRWKLCFMNHSGSLWLGVEQLPDAPTEQ